MIKDLNHCFLCFVNNIYYYKSFLNLFLLYDIIIVLSEDMKILIDHHTNQIYFIYT